DLGEDRLVHEARRGQARSAVDDTMPDGVDGRRRDPPLAERGERGANGRGPVAGPARVIAAADLDPSDRVATRWLEDHGLERARTRVEDEDPHPGSPGQKGHAQSRMSAGSSP